jgi:hypothetical protein
MLERLLRRGKIAFLLVGAFLFGGGSAEVAVRTHAALERVRHDREIGSAGQLVVLELTSPDGEVIARPRVIAPVGKAAHLVLHDPADPESVRLAFRVEAVREASGDIALAYALWVPDRAIAEQGKLSLTPGVEQAIEIGEGTLVASWLAVPVPSAAFDALMEVESTRRVFGRAS